jgi:hypothetical protein
VATAGGAEEPTVPPPSWRENIARLGRFSSAAWDWYIDSRARVA